MEISIFLPTSIYWKTDTAEKIIAEGREGYFTLLPRHIDYVAILVPGILTVENVDGTVFYFAVDHGTLVKRGPSVSISTRNAILGKEMEILAQVVEGEFKQISEMEKKSRSALTGLEYGLLRRFAELGKP
ncbi:MAG: F0F1 ATP synthase subunit epsilon [Desulfosarcina sp.]|nr:F0F1 ATP synthase subunit epsilon [Desulfosarcina sp.]MBC2742233.1 F0F1 ATP synthase subunit epsilon [Desulfosarcina sp.]MBC2765145.1 F0F1 ATP synthase subunit epsilon [Desulfosarcina sp.]